jgi:hypothetical protein
MSATAGLLIPDGWITISPRAAVAHWCWSTRITRTGRVFTAEELDTLAHLARRHDLLMISDEIHADLVYSPHQHIPFASLPGMSERTITLNSASKGFNLAGVCCAIAHLGRLREVWDSAPPPSTPVLTSLVWQRLWPPGNTATPGLPRSSHTWTGNDTS